MIDWTVTVALSSLVIGTMAYMVVWGLHNFDITVDTIMAWADQQNTFLQKLISCPMCCSVQLAVALTTLHCLTFNLGLWTWVATTLLSCFLALLLVIRLHPLDEPK